MIFRSSVESNARAAAGVIGETEDYYQCRVLNMFELYVSKTDESVSPHLMRDGFWESWITTWFINNIRPGDIFSDIGAHTGYYAYLAHHLGAKVLAFEPNPFYAEMIRRSRDLNEADVFVVVESALSDHDGTAILNVPLTLHGSGSLNTIPPGYEFTQVEVPVSRLDTVCKETTPGRQVLKIDAEGEEERVLAGAVEFLDRANDVLILLEYTPGAYSEDFIDELLNKWHVSWISFTGFEMPVTKDWILSQSDWVMLTLRRPQV